MGAGLPTVSSLWALPPAQREPPIPKELRERMGEWAANYPASLPGYTATETFAETRWDRRGRSEAGRQAVFRYSLVRNPEKPRELVESRELTRPAPIKASAASPSAVDQFSKLVLLITRLATQYHDRMKYFFAQDTSEVASDTVLIGYRQVSGAGLMEVDGKPVYPFGRAWVNPEDGSVERMEEEFEHKTRRYWIAVEFERSAELNAWVLVRVTVRTFEKGRLHAQHYYSYSAFRPLREQTQHSNPPQ